MTMLVPMALMVFYIWCIALATFIVRKKAVDKDRSLLKYYKIYSIAEASPPEFSVRMGQHYDNLMQVPLLFLITGCLCLFYKLNSPLVLALGWAFVFSRFYHGYIHLGSNHIGKRAVSFAFGWFMVIGLWIELAICTKAL